MQFTVLLPITTVLQRAASFPRTTFLNSISAAYKISNSLLFFYYTKCTVSPSPLSVHRCNLQVTLCDPECLECEVLQVTLCDPERLAHTTKTSTI